MRLLIPILLLAFLIILIRSVMFIGTVTSQSMSPTLEIGGRVLALKFFPTSRLKRGQIIIFKNFAFNERYQQDNGLMIKRIVALPNESSGIEVPEDHLLVTGDLNIEDGKIIEQENCLAVGEKDVEGVVLYILQRGSKS